MRKLFSLYRNDYKATPCIASLAVLAEARGLSRPTVEAPARLTATGASPFSGEAAAYGASPGAAR